MDQNQIEAARLWLELHKSEITRIRPRISGHIVRYIPRKGWGPGIDGHIAAPVMWARLDDHQDPMDAIFRLLNIPVDQPL